MFYMQSHMLCNIGTKCNSLTQQFIGISTFDSTDPISKVVKCTVGSHSALDYLVKIGYVVFEGLKMTR